NFFLGVLRFFWGVLRFAADFFFAAFFLEVMRVRVAFVAFFVRFFLDFFLAAIAAVYHWTRRGIPSSRDALRCLGSFRRRVAQVRAIRRCFRVKMFGTLPDRFVYGIRGFLPDGLRQDVLRRL